MSSAWQWKRTIQKKEIGKKRRCLEVLESLLPVRQGWGRKEEERMKDTWVAGKEGRSEERGGMKEGGREGG